MINSVIPILLGTVAYPWLVHQTLTSPLEQRAIYSLASAGLLLFIVVLMSARSRYRIPILGACLLFSAYIARNQSVLIDHIAWLYLFEYSIFNCILCFSFARTLVEGRTPMITHFATLIRGGSISPAIAAYTRKVTWAWAVFFGILMLVSLVLFLFSTQQVWSLFTTTLTPFLVLAMFVCEYAVRLHLLPHERHSGLLSVLRLVRIAPFRHSH